MQPPIDAPATSAESQPTSSMHIGDVIGEQLDRVGPGRLVRLAMTPAIADEDRGVERSITGSQKVASMASE